MTLCITAHEVRSSMSDEQLAPFSRIDDGRMHIMGVEQHGKISSIKFIAKMSKAKHLGMKNVNVREAKEVKIEPCSRSFFNIDGEIYRNDHLTVRHLKGIVTLFGQTFD